MNESYGLVASFARPDQLVAAAERVYDAGYRDFDTYSPIPIHALPKVMHLRATRLPWITFIGGLLGGLAGYLLQWWTSAVAYPLIIAGKPLHSWPAFIPVTFECIIAGAGFATVIGLFALNKLPTPYHPIFNTPGFERASIDRFFLCVRASDPSFDAVETRHFLQELAQELGADDVVAISW